jgi:DNA-binding SARP family transcriptional activator
MDRLLVYHNGTGEVSVYDDSSRTWSSIDTTTAHDQHYYEHATFADIAGDGLYAMGGYGWYTAKNTVQRYSFAERAWIPVAITGGDSVAPRYSAVVGEGDSAHLWYMFGGHGNGTGRQEASFHPLRDLWLLDLRGRSWTKIIDTLDADRDFIPQGIARAGATGDLLIVGGFVRKDTLAVQLLAVTPRSGTVRPLTDLPRDTQKQPFPLVAFDRRRGCVLLGTTRFENPRLTALEIYTHDYPPAPEIEPPSFAGLRDGDVKQLLLALGLTATLGFALWVYRKRHPSVDWGKYRGDSDHRDVLLMAKPAPPPPQSTRSAGATEIRLFGSFRLLDSTRRDWSSEFSPKILELFLLIATHGHAEPTKNDGIPVQKLTSILWPHSTKESAKNSRGVALKSLRDVLGEIGGMTITRRADRLVLGLDEGVALDLFTVQRLLAALEASAPDSTTESRVAELLEILERGALLESSQYAWLAEVRESVGRAVSSALFKTLPAFYTSTNVRLGLRVADRILAVDLLNESALRVKLHALAADGHHGEAAEVFSAFSVRYAEVFQRPFPRTLRDLLD